MIQMNGFDPGTIRAEVDTQGRMTISVLGAGGEASDTIFIHSQTYNYGNGNLVEWIRFDNGPKIALTEFDGMPLV